MQGLRFLLIIALAVLMDLGSPILPETADGFEELEEASHGRRRVLNRLTGAASQPARQTVVTRAIARPRPAWRQRARRSVAAAVKKLPPLRSDTASASDDH